MSNLTHLLEPAGRRVGRSYLTRPSPYSGELIRMVVPSLSPSGSLFAAGSYISDP